MTAAMQIAHRICPGRNSFVLGFTSMIVMGSLMAGCSNHPLNTIQITPVAGATKLTSKGQQAQFTATGQYGSSNRLQTTKDITASVTWTSSVPSVATIDSSGMAVAVGDGTTVITAKLGGDLGMEAGTSDVTVSGIGTGTGAGTRTLTTITISPGTQALTGTGQSGQFTAIGTFTGGAPATVDLTSVVLWSSSNVGVATISRSGLATAVGNGTTTITASAKDSSFAVITSTATVTVSGAGTGSGARDLSTVAITPATQALNTFGEMGQFIAIGTYSSGMPSTVDMTNGVTWSSSDLSVATITASGLATAVGNGTTTITAIAKAASGSVIPTTAIVTVSNALAGGPKGDLTSIAISPGSQPLTLFGQTGQFLAIGSYSGGAPTQNITGLSAWTSSNVSVATISPSGLASAVADGITTITAIATAPISHAVILSTATVTVTGTGTSAGARIMTKLAISPDAQTLSDQGENGQFTAIGTFAGGTPTTQDMTNLVVWSSSNVGVATINSIGRATTIVPTGQTTPVRDGNTAITATYTDAANRNNVVTGFATVSVVSTSPLKRQLISIALLPVAQSVKSVGETAQFIAIGTYSSGVPLTVDLTSKVTWVSSDVTVANVTSSGLATAVRTALNGGAAAITAQYADPSDPTSSVITASAAFTFTAPSVAAGNTLPLLTIYEVGTGKGTVTSSPTPIACGLGATPPAVDTCIGNFTVGTTVTLTALAGAGYTFDPNHGWSSNCLNASVVSPYTCTIKIGESNEAVGVIFNN